MPVQNPIQLPDPVAGQITDTRGDGTRLLAAVMFLGRFHHLTMLRATETPCDLDGEVTTAAESDHTEWRADNQEDQEELMNLRNLYDADFESVEVPGYQGQYIVSMTPHGR